MGTITKWNVFFVLVVSLIFAVCVGGIGPSPAFGWPFASGWMTGGGSIFSSIDGSPVVYGGQVALDGRVTHGFVVHCEPRRSDNLEVVDHSTGLNFHLTDLLVAECIDNPELEPNPPGAAFDTFVGAGPGRCKGGLAGNHWTDCWIEFTFTDNGEPGCQADFADIAISFEQGGTPFFSIAGFVNCGNHQAHDGF